MDSDVVDNTTDGEDAEDCSRGVQVIISVSIMSYAVDSITPEPLAHDIAVGMDEQHAKGGGSYRIEEVRLRDAHVLEEHKGGNAYQQCQYRIRVRYKEEDGLCPVECVVTP